MTGRDDLVERLLHRDSAAHMDGSANWVVDAHPDDPSRPGQIVVQIPWQANDLLIEAAAELDDLVAERDRLREAIRAHRDAVKCCDECATAQVEERDGPDGVLWAEVDRGRPHSSTRLGGGGRAHPRPATHGDVAGSGPGVPRHVSAARPLATGGGPMSANDQSDQSVWVGAVRRIDQPRGRLVGYVWWCGDDYCNCHQAVIEWEGWHCERVWAGKFRTDGGWAECNRDLNRTAQWMRRHHHDLYQAIRWPWVTA